jgi:hypothetical protein
MFRNNKKQIFFYYVFVVDCGIDGKISFSGIHISGANKNWPFKRPPFLNRSDLTLADE